MVHTIETIKFVCRYSCCALLIESMLHNCIVTCYKNKLWIQVVGNISWDEGVWIFIVRERGCCSEW